MVEWLWVGSDGDLCFCWEGKEMSEIIELLCPIYLDIPMMISFVATMDGGYSLEKVWKQTDYLLMHATKSTRTSFRLQV